MLETPAVFPEDFAQKPFCADPVVGIPENSFAHYDSKARGASGISTGPGKTVNRQVFPVAPLAA